MGATVAAFLAVGGFALLLMVLGLAGGRTHLGHVHLGHLHIGHLHLGHFQLGHAPTTAHPTAGVDLSLPVIAGFLGAFGFGGAIVGSLVPAGGGVQLLLAAVGGLVAAVPSGWLAGRLMRAAMDIPTDATLTSGDLIGATGVVVTPVPAGGYGEVRLAVAGQLIKFNARSDEPLALGARVFVISVPTPSSVLVETIPTAAD